ncbi:MAG: hypothetical protein AAGI03_00630 [Pseudomonadota bacterium]
MITLRTYAENRRRAIWRLAGLVAWTLLVLTVGVILGWLTVAADAEWVLP